MSNPLHARFLADHACQQTVPIVENVILARDTMRVRLECPEIAATILPGQFVMVRIHGLDDPLIGRPLALYDTADDASGRPAYLDVVYLVKGKFTQRLATMLPGQAIDVWGPLGNGFQLPDCRHLVMVAGGIGQTPMLAVAKHYQGLRRYADVPPRAGSDVQVSFCYGARSGDLLAGVEDFQATGIDVQLATDDGSYGHHGLVTDLLSRLLDTSSQGVHILCCGPEPMMEAVAAIARDRRVPCQVSLETPMACGIGICFTCVARIVDQQGNWDYKRTCVEGPVFDSASVVW